MISSEIENTLSVNELTTPKGKLIYFSIILFVLTSIKYELFSIPAKPETTLLVIFKYFVEHGYHITVQIISTVVLFLTLKNTLYNLKVTTIKKHNAVIDEQTALLTPITKEKYDGKPTAEQVEEFTKINHKMSSGKLNIDPEQFHDMIIALSNPLFMKAVSPDEDKQSYPEFTSYISLSKQKVKLRTSVLYYTKLISYISEWSPVALGTFSFIYSIIKMTC